MRSPDMENLERHVWTVQTEVCGLRDAIRACEPEDFDTFTASPLVSELSEARRALRAADIELAQLWDRAEQTPLPMEQKESA